MHAEMINCSAVGTTPASLRALRTGDNRTKTCYVLTHKATVAKPSRRFARFPEMCSSEFADAIPTDFNQLVAFASTVPQEGLETSSTKCNELIDVDFHFK